MLGPASDASYLVPLADLGMVWTEPGFDAASAGFTPGKAAMGYEGRPDDRTNFSGEIQTTLPSGTHAALTRVEFQLARASAISTMTLRLKYDNGFVAYINGQKVAEASAPADLSWYATATDGSRRDTLVLEQVELDLTDYVVRCGTARTCWPFTC